MYDSLNITTAGTNLIKNKNVIGTNNTDLICSYAKNPEMSMTSIDKEPCNFSSDTTLACSQLVAYNNSTLIVRFAILDFNSLLEIYVSDKVYEWKTVVIKLDELNIIPGTLLVLKVNYLSRKPSYAGEYLEYTPNSNTVYFEHCTNEDGFLDPVYRGMVKSPLSPPVLKCTGLFIKCVARVNTKYEFRLATTGLKIYITNKTYDLDDFWVFSLDDLNIAPGTQVRVHASVVGGKDCEPYVILEYDPTVSIDEDTARLFLVGNVFYTTMYFKGVD